MDNLEELAKLIWESNDPRTNWADLVKAAEEGTMRSAKEIIDHSRKTAEIIIQAGWHI